MLLLFTIKNKLCTELIQYRYEFIALQLLLSISHFILTFLCSYVPNYFLFFRLREKKESVTVLLCGTSGCGKSTLSAILVYFSTEIVICSIFYLFCGRIRKYLMKYKTTIVAVQ